MNKLLPNLLLVLSMALCGLSAYQWVREGKLRKDIAFLHDTIHTNRATIQSLEVNVRQQQAETDRLEKIRTDLNNTILTNTARILELDKYASKLERESQAQKDAVEQFKTALETANDRIRSQNADIVKQNEALKQVGQQRDEKVAELAKVVGEYNKLVKDYNKVVEDMEKLVQQVQAANKEQKK